MKRDLAILRREVSRSFDLSLRVLPGAMRDGVGIAYLLARASDTLADTAAVPVAERLSCLDGFAEEMASGKRDWRRGLAAFAGRQDHAGERRLLESLDDCMELLDALPAAQAAMVREVVGTIIGGQRLDLLRFGDGGGQLRNAAELEDYCFRVAGCVGVFWTRMGRSALGDRFSEVDDETMESLGDDFGRGLQLVNILRDVGEDGANGRCYLPGVDPQDPQAMLAVARTWCRRAAAGLDAGIAYAGNLKNWRLRTATVLPALIGVETLERIHARDSQSPAVRVKVSRAVVRSCLWQAMIFRHQPGLRPG